MIRSAAPSDVTARPALHCEIVPDRPFSLDRAARQIAALTGARARPAQGLLLAFPAEVTWEPVAVSLAEQRGRLIMDISGGPAQQVAAQVARMLSLDVG